MLCWPALRECVPLRESWIKDMALARVIPRESKAPAFIRFSSTFLFTFLVSTLLRKSSMDRKGPFLSLVSRIDSMAAEPTPLTASSPNLMELPITLNSLPLRFMSGGRICMDIFLHSAIKWTILSVLSISVLRVAAINSTG